MKIDFDPAKSACNLAERGLPFERVGQFDFATALFSVDARRDYGETRWRALGYLGDRLHALVFVDTPEGIRVISLRKANQRKVRRYEQATKP